MWRFLCGPFNSLTAGGAVTLTHSDSRAPMIVDISRRSHESGSVWFRLSLRELWDCASLHLDWEEENWWIKNKNLNVLAIKWQSHNIKLLFSQANELRKRKRREIFSSLGKKKAPQFVFVAASRDWDEKSTHKLNCEGDNMQNYHIHSRKSGGLQADNKHSRNYLHFLLSVTI